MHGVIFQQLRAFAGDAAWARAHTEAEFVLKLYLSGTRGRPARRPCPGRATSSAEELPPERDGVVC